MEHMSAAASATRSPSLPAPDNGMGPAAREKAFLGYSDTGYLLAALYRAGIGRPAHGPMAADIRRGGGEGAVMRALDWLCGKDDGL